MTRFESKLIGAGFARSLTNLMVLAALLISASAQARYRWRTRYQLQP